MYWNRPMHPMRWLVGPASSATETLSMRLGQPTPVERSLTLKMQLNNSCASISLAAAKFVFRYDRITIVHVVIVSVCRCSTCWTTFTVAGSWSTSAEAAARREIVRAEGSTTTTRSCCSDWRSSTVRGSSQKSVVFWWPARSAAAALPPRPSRQRYFTIEYNKNKWSKNFD